MEGFSSGGLASLAASAVGLGGAAAGIDGSKTFGTLFFGTLSGGVGSALTGGNFWQGAAIGLTVSWLNHEKHKIIKPIVKEEPLISKSIKRGLAKASSLLGTPSLEFDGKTLSIYENGELVSSYKAVSGRSLDGKGLEFDYSVERQKMKGIGPLPEGIYTLDPHKVQYWNDQSFGTKTKAILGRGTWPGGPSSWGFARVWLNPVATTNTYGRSDFSIHGGEWYGSAGCIDLWKNDIAFFNDLSKYVNYLSVYLYVNY